ncbi:MAG: rhodanese-like domain-containing protein [Desulfovibrio sp.]|nr:rhodanese-like domain-containing protein [Desulfovibrio sp.]
MAAFWTRRTGALAAALALCCLAEGATYGLFGRPARPSASYERLSVAEAWERIRTTPSLLVVDVRTPREFKDRHLRGSVNAPLFELHRLAPKLPAGRPVLVVSLQGIRSIQACKLLKRLRPDIGDVAYADGPIFRIFQPRPARRASSDR